MSRAFDRLAKGEAAVGAMMMEHGAEWLETMGYVGMDWAWIDFMNTSVDWAEAANMIRACNRYDVTPGIRLQAYPWGESEIDPRLPADVMRALSIGAEMVGASVNTARAVAAMIRPAADQGHVRLYVNKPLHPSRPGYLRRDDDHSNTPIVFPLLETTKAIENIDEILEVDGLKAIFLATADISRGLGHGGDMGHPEVRDIVRDITARANKRKVATIVPAVGDTPERVVEDIRWLHSIGVPILYLPRLTIVVQRFYERVLHSVEDIIPGDQRR